VIEILTAELRELTGFPLVDVCLAATLFMVSAQMFWASTNIGISSSQTLVRELLGTTIFTGFTIVQLFAALVSAVASSLSVARDYETGKMHAILTLPVSRKTYLFSKIVSSILLMFTVSMLSLAAGVIPGFYPYPAELIYYLAGIIPVVILLSMFYTSLFTLVALLLRKPVPSMMMSVVAALALETGGRLLGEKYWFLPPQCYLELARRLLGLKALSYAPLILSLLYPVPLLLAAILFFEKLFEVGK